MKFIKTPLNFSVLPKYTRIKSNNATGWEIWWFGFKIVSVEYYPEDHFEY